MKKKRKYATWFSLSQFDSDQRIEKHRSRNV